MAQLSEVLKLGQSIWLDYIRRDLVTSGQLKRLVDDGLRGMTSNPTIFEKAVGQSNVYDDAIRATLQADPRMPTAELYNRLVIQDIQMAADAFRPVYDSSGKADGFVSLEPPAQLAYDTEATLTEIKSLWRRVARPNVMMKVPATPQGISAVEQLLAEGINVNITLMFSMEHYEAVAQTYLCGIARCPNPADTSSVASFFVSRVDTAVDKAIEKIGTPEALALRGKAAVANSKLVYARFQELFGPSFDPQRHRGAHVQRPLWASTSTKNPAYPDVIYVDNLIGPDTVNTLPMETVDKFRDHGQARRTVDADLAGAQKVMADLERLGIDMDAITEQLQVDGVKAFVDSLDHLLVTLEEKRKQMQVSAR